MIGPDLTPEARADAHLARLVSQAERVEREEREIAERYTETMRLAESITVPRRSKRARPCAGSANP